MFGSTPLHCSQRERLYRLSAKQRYGLIQRLNLSSETVCRGVGVPDHFSRKFGFRSQQSHQVGSAGILVGYGAQKPYYILSLHR
jgi:hypothetical protein